MKNFLFSHPRSGRNWQRHRLLYFFRNILKYQHFNFDELVHFTHIGFGDALLNQGPIETGRWTKNLRETDNITVLLRDNKAVISSYHRYVKRLFPKAITDLALDLDDIHGFVISPLGIAHYIEFMHTAEAIITKGVCTTWRVIYYEDAFQKDFISILPSIAGIDYKLSDNEINEISFNSQDTPTKVIGFIDSYKTYLSQKSQDFIDEYTQKHCNFKPYIERYL